MNLTVLSDAADLLFATVARADAGWSSDGTTWLLLVVGMVAIGVYAAARARRD